MVEFTTPVGRIVWGNPTKARGKTRKNVATGANEPVMKADGTQAQQWAFGVAFPKAEFEAHIWPMLAAEAATVYPSGQVPPKFAWKYQDGDGVDDQGKSFATREGYAGCHVLAFSTELQAPPIFKLVNGAYQQQPGDAIKCGDFVSVGVNAKANVPADRSMTPGIYINPTAVEFIGYGAEIVSQGSADPNAIFKGQQHALPAGASATPLATAGAPGMPGMGMMQPAMQPAMTPPAPVAVPAAPPPPPAPVAVPGRPVDPSHIAPDGRGGELWWSGAAWTPAPAHDFVQAATGMPPAPGTMAMPGTMPPR